ERARAAGSEPPVHEPRGVDRLLVRLAAVHGAAGVRGARADSGVVPRGLGRSRRTQLADVPLRDPAAVAAGTGRRLDLHVRSDPRRLHLPRPRWRHGLQGDRELRRGQFRDQPPVRGGLCRDPDGGHGRLPADRAAAGSVRGAMTTRGARISLAVWSVLVIAFLWIPLVIIALYAFNGSTLQGWPITSWTTHWFGVAWHDPDVRSAFELSVQVGAITTVIALVLGAMAAAAV